MIISHSHTSEEFIFVYANAYDARYKINFLLQFSSKNLTFPCKMGLHSIETFYILFRKWIQYANTNTNMYNNTNLMNAVYATGISRFLQCQMDYADGYKISDQYRAILYFFFNRSIKINRKANTFKRVLYVCKCIHNIWTGWHHHFHFCKRVKFIWILIVW